MRVAVFLLIAALVQPAWADDEPSLEPQDFKIELLDRNGRLDPGWLFAQGAVSLGITGAGAAATAFILYNLALNGDLIGFFLAASALSAVYVFGVTLLSSAVIAAMAGQQNRQPSTLAIYGYTLLSMLVGSLALQGMTLGLFQIQSFRSPTVYVVTGAAMWLLIAATQVGVANSTWGWGPNPDGRSARLVPVLPPVVAAVDERRDSFGLSTTGVSFAF